MIDTDEQKRQIQIGARIEKIKKQRAQAKLHTAQQMTQIIQVTVGSLSLDDDNAISTLLQNFVGVAVFRGADREQILKLVNEQWDHQAALKAKAEEKAKAGEDATEPLIVAPGSA